jgi:predicted TPR repeat methyltransferase
MSKPITDPKLWTPRSVEETMSLYQNWAETYDAELAQLGYMTPARLAAALAGHLPADTALLDFGCGTGLSGAALKTAGFQTFDGTDITPEMLAKAEDRGIYRKLWQGTPGNVDVPAETYGAIFAAGVISLGAAPAELMAVLLNILPKDGLLAFSYNDPTLQDQTYLDALDAVLVADAELLVREYGPHLTGKDMSSDVIILRKR